MIFNSGFSVIGVLPKYQEEEVKNEPMIFSGDRDFSWKNGGPITRAFIAGLGAGYTEDYIVDSRVHMLMPGWYPAIPGWHLDDVPRTRSDGQPEHEHPAYKASNIMAIVGDASVTEFVVGKLELKEIGIKEGAVYGKWNAEINKKLAEGNREIYVRNVPEGKIVKFDFGAFHRAVPASKVGWRFFIRANFNTARVRKNEIRRQTQVYLSQPEAGW